MVDEMRTPDIEKIICDELTADGLETPRTHRLKAMSDKILELFSQHQEKLEAENKQLKSGWLYEDLKRQLETYKRLHAELIDSLGRMVKLFHGDTEGETGYFVKSEEYIRVIKEREKLEARIKELTPKVHSESWWDGDTLMWRIYEGRKPVVLSDRQIHKSHHDVVRQLDIEREFEKVHSK